jgi:transglutaminase-like putative cysteine protease
MAEPQLPWTPLRRATRVALVACFVLGVALPPGTLLALDPRWPHFYRTWILWAVVMFAAERQRAAGAAEADGVGIAAPWRQLGWVLVQLAGVGTLIASADPARSALPVLLGWVFLLLLERVGRPLSPHVLLPVLLLQAALAVQTVPHFLSRLVALGTGILVLFTAALLTSRSQYQLRHQSGLPSAALRTDDPWALLARLRAITLCVVAIFALSAVLGALGNALVDAVGPEPPAPRASAGTGPIETVSSNPRRTGYALSVDYAASFGELGEDVVLELRATRRGAAEPGAVAPELRLAGLHLDRFTAEGARCDVVPELVLDGDDGRDDGWIDIAPGEPWTLEYELAAVPLPVEGGRPPLFATEPLLAVSGDAVLWHERGLVTATEVPDGLLRYRVRVGAPRSWSQALADGRIVDPGGLALSLPPESPALEALRQRAREIVGPATDPRSALRAVLAHFAGGFSYSQQSSAATGLDGLLEFLDRREGFCTAYATAAALLLRLEGVPTRVVTGYLVDEYDAERRTYVARAKDAHAWFQVFFRDLGWVDFDATPARAAREAVAARDDTSLHRWWAQLQDEWQAFRGGADRGWQRVAEKLAELPGALLATARERPRWALGAGLVAAVLLLGGIHVRRRWRRLLRETATTSGTLAPAAPSSLGSWYRELSEALARLGRPRPPAATPRQFARSLLESRFPEGSTLTEATEVYYADRFGGQPPSPRERAALDGLLARLRSRRNRSEAGE